MKNKKINILQAVSIIIGIFLIGNAICVFPIAAHIGLLVEFILGVLFLFYGLFYKKINTDKVKYVHSLMALTVSVILLFSGFLAIYGSTDKVNYNESAVIVLGSGLKGETVAPNLAKRLDKAAEYYNKNPHAVFIVSGGQGPNESITEALAMERYLVKKGVPESQIIKELQLMKILSSPLKSLKKIKSQQNPLFSLRINFIFFVPNKSQSH